MPPDSAARTVEYKGECWPSLEQELLLRAALTRDEGSLAAWQAWRERVAVEDIDAGSRGLLPLLSRSLEQQGIRHPEMRRYTSVYKQAWYRNQIILSRMVEVLTFLHAKHIDTLILKGAPLLLFYYEDIGARVMNDFDVLVPSEQAEDAIKVIEATEWHTEFSTASSRVRLTHSVLFEDGADDFDLHWHVMEECCLPDADRAFWENAVPVSHMGVNTRALDAADQLMHVIVHGLRWAEVPPLRWVADSMMVLSKAGDRIDWGRLLAQSIRCSVVLPVHYGLCYLSERFAAPVPQEVLSQFSETHIPRRQVMEFRVKAIKRTPWRRLLFHWFNYQRLKQVVGSRLLLFGFLQYLQQRWGLKHFWQFPRFVIAEAARRRRRVF